MLIGTYKMLDFTGILPGFEDITYRKEKDNSVNKWLYSFRNAYRAT